MTVIISGSRRAVHHALGRALPRAPPPWSSRAGILKGERLRAMTPALPKDTVCLITGASSGIGLAIAERLLERGCRVIAIARNRARLAEAFKAYGDRVLALPLDVTDRDAVAGMVEGLPDDWRQIGVAIANAGSDVGGRKSFAEGAMADWAGTIEINVIGLMAVCHAVLPGMLDRGRGHLVTLGSVAGLWTYANVAAYTASKHAVRAFTEALRRELARSPIRITELLPGLVETGFAEARLHGDLDQAKAFYDAAPGALTPENIAAAALFALEQPATVNISQIVITPTTDKQP